LPPRACMKISVIVPAFNEEKLLVASLRSMKAAMEAFSEAGCESELVVCNNNSTDNTESLARQEGAKVIFEPVNQIARARNTGASAATGDWLVFVDADSHPSRELFRDVVATIRRGNVLAGGSTVKVDGDHPVANFVVGFWNALSRFRKWAAGSFIFCDAKAFGEVGGFSNELYASEEIELFQRLHRRAKALGRKIVILHEHPLITSDRKMRLYTPAEHFRFLAKTVFRFGRTFKDPKECHTWYDGRR
jgi:glycosyltransferase involved in cell wall biosynthesis